MQATFQELTRTIVGNIIKADYVFRFSPINLYPIMITAQVVATIPDPVFVSFEEATESVLEVAVHKKLEELEEGLPGYIS